VTPAASSASTPAAAPSTPVQAPKAAAPPPAPAQAPAASTSTAAVPETPTPAGANFNDPSALAMGAQRDAAVANMMEMGFPREDIDRAMRAAFNNPDRAVEYLMTVRVWHSPLWACRC
jgi:UV excision repair protein RAD23